jgi:hypothetical protein
MIGYLAPRRAAQEVVERRADILNLKQIFDYLEDFFAGHSFLFSELFKTFDLKLHFVVQKTKLSIKTVKIHIFYNNSSQSSVASR